MEPTGDVLFKMQNELKFYQCVGSNIRKFRIGAGLTQEDLAFILNISRVSVNNIELGKQRLPLHLIASICGLFKARMHEIIPPYDYKVKSMIDLFEHKKQIEIDKINNKFNN